MDYKEWILFIMGDDYKEVGCRFAGIVTDWGKDLNDTDRLYCKAYFEIIDSKKFEEFSGSQNIVSFLLDTLGFHISNCRDFSYGIKEIGSFVEASRNRAYAYLGFDSGDRNMTERVFDILKKESDIFFGWDKNEHPVSMGKEDKVWIEKVKDDKEMAESFDKFIMNIIGEYERKSLLPEVIYLPFTWKILTLLGDWLKPRTSVMKSNGMDKIMVGMQWGICFIVDKELLEGIIKVEFKKNGEKKIETRYLNAFWPSDKE